MEIKENNRPVLLRFLLIMILVMSVSSSLQAAGSTASLVDFSVAKDTVVNTPTTKRNPFNPLMDLQKADNFGYDGMGTKSVTIHYTDSLSLPFFRPVVFVPNNQPKFDIKPLDLNPKKIDLNFLTVNDTVIGYWVQYNRLGLDINQISFVNWSAGGDNSVSGLFKGDFKRKYVKGRLNWDSELVLRYGLNQQEGRESRKTDDAFQLNSTIGYKSSEISDWYYTAKFNFNTQFANGYSYPNTDLPISKLFAPAYLFVGAGAEYSLPHRGVTVYFSPLTLKSTFVADQRLADQGAFGVDKAIYNEQKEVIRHGKRSKSEVGLLVTNQWKKEILKNIFIDHRLSLYSDYFNRFGNIDIDWQLQLDMKINQYVRANIGTHIIYDDDIKNKVEKNGVQVIEGPRFQIKQILAIGLVYLF
ncbi:DUF3078 domain-containing protein [Flavobacterium sp. NKUCC04_CG]|uniref:DUF3078 domain-containing protein n=1 Tax=Flavobacterium sp. NKUCC04_CG TaxID=2842121 RepID=UPI002107FEB5|nr:DUF3078 domain-containing protein [Flavobacterium sp. NKUCC04_CG]